MSRGFDDDPFFRDFNQGFRGVRDGAGPGGSLFGDTGPGGSLFSEIDNMMGNMMLGTGSNQGMLEGPRRSQPGRTVAGRKSRDPFSDFFPDVGTMMRGLESADGHSFSSHQVYSYKKEGDGPPQEYQAISTETRAPGGLKETKKGYKDSVSNSQKMQYGRHIKDRATIQERSQVRDKREEKTDYVGFGEDEANQFDSEWSDKAPNLYRPSVGRANRPKGLGKASKGSARRALPRNQ